MINVPENAVKYIKAQRCSIQRAKLAKSQHFIDDWVKSCQEESTWLLENVPMGKSLLDIGCGLGGVDVLLAPVFDHLYLLDGTGWDGRRAAYQDVTDPWNSLDITRDVMAMNGLDNKTTLINYRDRPDIKVDTVISTASWCYHYPVDEYLSWVADVINPGGHLCVDIRFSENYFSECDKIEQAGFKPTKSKKLISWVKRWKGIRQVYVKE